ncbi:DUF4291 domain-containing protein [Spirosoma sp. KCTC 42546]|uniref:DUF4291 domain-containing protein n=1 Tax=Spirosoma sp. KCTC 42546 TaxID=2520506 RepID=UPI00115BC8C7|nr:DUF4291 domain-containing protein [Spirosoma sp. KCTC 42546]QDK80727.1 DUF4291 domain-containing protein [Spirosoma sp. KCTC 42546]
MTLKTIPYLNYETDLPQAAQLVLGQLRGQNIIVYQAFNPQIVDYAVAHQRFGGPAYSFSRMAWIKPNFLWMMYRSGWAKKENQEKIVAIEISLENFETLLKQAVHSSFQPAIYSTREHWKTSLIESEVRLQWDPDHNPTGRKLERRAIQLGLKGDTLKLFATDWIVSIEDITEFVLDQGRFVEKGAMEKLTVIKEQVIPISNPHLTAKLKLTN